MQAGGTGSPRKTAWPERKDYCLRRDTLSCIHQRLSVMKIYFVDTGILFSFV